jgi:hypothetical protein
VTFRSRLKIKVTEHQLYKKQCICGHVNEFEYPTEANAPVSYGNNIESLIGYFHTRQYLPFKRMQEMFNDVFNAPISEGGLHYILDKLVCKAKSAYELIKQRMQANTKLAVGSDETGMKVNGDKHWAWTWQNKESTFITITDNRAQRSITNTFKDGFKSAVLVHDCWDSHFNTPAISHQVCIAHLLRDINYLTELYNHKWSSTFKLLFQLSIIHKKQKDKVDYYYPDSRRNQFERRLDYCYQKTIMATKLESALFIISFTVKSLSKNGSCGNNEILIPGCMVIVPESATSSPVSILNKVDLPVPLFTTSATLSPFANPKLTFSKSTFSP